MKARSLLRRARKEFWLTVLFVLVGLVPVTYFLALFGWQWSVLVQTDKWIALPLTLAFSDPSLPQAAAPVLPYIPRLPWTATQTVAEVLDFVHVGLIPALLGLLIMALGLLRALHDRAVIHVLKQHKEDSVRRLQDYRREDPRIEPIDARREPYIGSIDRSADRRVA